MKKTIRLILMLLLIILLIGSCNFPTSTNKFGYIIISAKFPQNSFKIKTIPLATTKIGIELSGDGLPKILNFTLTPEKSELTILTYIGKKTILATAYDDSNNILAFGKNSAFLQENTHNKVEIILIEGATSEYPTGIQTPAITEIPTTPTIGGEITSSTPIASTKPTEKPIPTINPTASPSSMASSASNTNTYIPEVRANINIILSTPIPSGITAGFSEKNYNKL